MGFKAANGIHWSNIELAALVEDEDSCVVLERVHKHLGLHPYHLTDLNAALNEILSASLNFYDPEVNGLILAYKNPKLLSSLGEILYDTCFVHVDIEADFYIFRPEIGRSLKGFVNKKGTNHVGILLHKAFNVSVPKLNNKKKEAEEEEEEEDNDNNWPGDKVKVGQEIRFTLDEIDYKSKLPYIRGSLHENDYLRGCKLFNEEIAATFESEFQEITRNSFSENNKPKNKRVVFNSDLEDNLDSDLENKSSIKVNISEEILKSPKKKHKRKSLSPCKPESESPVQYHEKQKHKQNSNLSQDSLNNSDDDTVRKKKMKKRKNDVDNKEILENANINITNGTVEEESSVEEDKKNIIIDTSVEENIETSHKKSKKSKIKQTENIYAEDRNESDSQLATSKSRKRKRSDVENDVLNDTEDEKNYKSSISKIINNCEEEFVVPQSPLKKRKKKHSTSELNDDTEDERKNKKSLIKNLVELNSTENQKIFAMDSEVLDTEDEKNYKSLIPKTLNHSEIIETPPSPSKRRKKKHSTSELNDDTEDERKHKKSLIKNLVELNSTENQKIFAMDSEVLDTEDEKNYKSLIPKIINNCEEEFVVPQSPSKRRRKKHSTSELNDDTEDERKHKKSLIKNLVELNSTENQKIFAMDSEVLDTEDEKNYKSLIPKIINNCEEEFVVPQSPSKRRKKKHSISELNDDTEDERKYKKSLIKNVVELNSTEMQKIFAMDSEVLDTEDEKNYKSLIPKTLNHSEIIETPPSPSKRRKKKHSTSELNDDTEDERKHKKSLIKNLLDLNNSEEHIMLQINNDLSEFKDEKNDESFESIAVKDNEAHFAVPQSPLKKRKKRHSVSETNDDTEDERKHKKSILKNLSETMELNDTKNEKSKSSNSQKMYTMDSELLDTEDEKNYKSFLEPLVQKLETDNQIQNSFDLEKPKKKKHKRKHKSSESESISQFNITDIVIKKEPESESEGKCKKKTIIE